jgi:hypothetical protein
MDKELEELIEQRMQPRPQCDIDLFNALSKYDFDGMVKAVKEGAEIDNMILHRVINRDRVDLLEYFVFSPELPNHCNINYTYDQFGENAPFVYACLCNAIKCVKFMLRDPRVANVFDIKECAGRAFQYVCTQGATEVFEFLISAPETKEFCNMEELRKDNFKAIQKADFRRRWEFLNHLVETLDLDLVNEFIPKIIKAKRSCRKILTARNLDRELDNSNQGTGKPRKI